MPGLPGAARLLQPYLWVPRPGGASGDSPAPTHGQRGRAVRHLASTSPGARGLGGKSQSPPRPPPPNRLAGSTHLRPSRRGCPPEAPSRRLNGELEAPRAPPSDSTLRANAPPTSWPGPGSALARTSPAHTTRGHRKEFFKTLLTEYHDERTHRVFGEQNLSL